MIDTNNSKIGSPFPFRVFCQKVIPLAFDESMSYLELLYSVLHYLKETVIPAVNNNADAVTELQNLYNELKSYVDNYFENLDVQEEINNKLDEMAESGQLAEIISLYLDYNLLQCYNTNAELKQSTSLNNGSFARTYGKLTYNDGYGAFYKIRLRTNQDEPDDDNLIVLINTENLIAEKMFDNNIINLQNQINNINNRHTIEDSNKSIFIGDSYMEGYTNDGYVAESNRFAQQFCQMQGITNYNIFYKGGIGFLQEVDGINFLKLLQNNMTNISDKNMVKNIFVFGGYNDAYTNPSINSVSVKIQEFVEYCAENFPNAKVYIGDIGQDVRATQDGSNRRQYIANKIQPAYSNTNIVKPSYIYLSNLTFTLLNKSLMASDGYHPNTAGHERLANAIYNSFNNNNTTNLMDYEYVTMESIDTYPNSINCELFVANNLNNKTIKINRFYGNFSSPSKPTISNAFTVIGDFSSSNLIIPTYDQIFPINAVIKDNSNNYTSCHALLRFQVDGKLAIAIKEIQNNGWKSISNVEYIELPALSYFVDKRTI